MYVGLLVSTASIEWAFRWKVKPKMRKKNEKTMFGMFGMRPNI